MSHFSSEPGSRAPLVSAPTSVLVGLLGPKLANARDELPPRLGAFTSPVPSVDFEAIRVRKAHVHVVEVKYHMLRHPGLRVSGGGEAAIQEKERQ